MAGWVWKFFFFFYAILALWKIHPSLRRPNASLADGSSVRIPGEALAKKVVLPLNARKNVSDPRKVSGANVILIISKAGMAT